MFVLQIWEESKSRYQYFVNYVDFCQCKKADSVDLIWVKETKTTTTTKATRKKPTKKKPTETGSQRNNIDFNIKN